jgi:hypothetical protein
VAAELVPGTGGGVDALLKQRYSSLRMAVLSGGRWYESYTRVPAPALDQIASRRWEIEQLFRSSFLKKPETFLAGFCITIFEKPELPCRILETKI